jgi:ABC-type multidrug transport system ATPase subunit
VRLALAFVHRPKLVLLDEPLNSLDAQGVRLVADAITRLRFAGGACIWASPEPPEVGIEFHQRLSLSDGRLEAA